MAIGIVPVAMSQEVAYSVLPSMIYNKKVRGESLTSPFTLLHFPHFCPKGDLGSPIDAANAHIWSGAVAKRLPKPVTIQCKLTRGRGGTTKSKMRKSNNDKAPLRWISRHCFVSTELN